jgi:hypothetical protein
MIEVIGSLLDAKEKYIVHQTNCMSNGAASGIAWSIFQAFPYADIYKNRIDDDHPGSIIVCGNGQD